MDAEQYARIIAGDVAFTSGSEWKAAIAQYQADIMSGRICFGPSKFATGPGEAGADADLSAFLASKLPEMER
jgi:hypothetical protein